MAMSLRSLLLAAALSGAACLATLLAASTASTASTESDAVDAATGSASRWSPGQLRAIDSLRLSRLPSRPIDPSNRWMQDRRAAELGHRLFFDRALSRNGEVACTTCHNPQRAFTDGRARSRGLGTTRRGAPSLIGAAYQAWQYWDGRRDSLWSQALTPIEHPDEMGMPRVDFVRRVLEQPELAGSYAVLFGGRPDLSDGRRFPAGASPLGNSTQRRAWQGMEPQDRTTIDRAFSNLGKALAAYEALLRPGPSRFDRYADAVVAGESSELLDAEELNGLELFIGSRAQCLRCHNGPLFSNGGFHGIGLPFDRRQGADWGRAAAITEVDADPFNCAGPYSDAQPASCHDLRFMRREGETLRAAFKVPTLRNVARTAPYMHSGLFESLEQVVAHYSRPPLAGPGHQELVALNLTEVEQRRLVAFLRTLDAPVDASERWLAPPAPPSATEP